MANVKKARRKIALNKTGSFRMLQVLEMSASVEKSKIPLGVGANLELIEMLLTSMYSITSLWESTSGCQLYLKAALFNDET